MIIFFMVVLGACAESQEAEPVGDRLFEDLFALQNQIVLEEIARDPLVEIRDFKVLRDGRVMVVDRKAARVRIFKRDGRIESTFGRFGMGPGEFKEPQSAAERSHGRLLVVEGGSPRLTILAPDGSVDSVLTLPAYLGQSIERLGDDFLVGMGREGEQFGILNYSGHVVSTFASRDAAVHEAPYWISFVWDRATVAGNYAIVNTSFFPTLRVFDAAGDSLRSFGSPPPSWIAATRPERGAYVGPGGMERAQEWLRSFTVVAGLATMEDSLVVVQYGRHDPDVTDMWHLNPSTIDVYHFEGRKLFEDVPMPRRILAGGQFLYVLEKEPPDPWTIGIYEWRGAERP